MISIIIRTLNEDKNLQKLLSILSTQTIKHEIIVVDSGSTDDTINIAKNNGCIIESCIPFTYGRSLNIGIKRAQYNYVCNLSAHCFPTSDKYLEIMLNNFDHSRIAGVYSKQLPTDNANILDKRNLSIIFRDEKLYQQKDSFFNNASSMIRKDIWNYVPFDEKIEAWEDIKWSKEVQSMNYIIVYEPETAVYHYHNEGNDITIKRYENEWSSYKEIIKNTRTIMLGENTMNDLKVLAIIPAKGDSTRLPKKNLQTINGLTLAEHAINYAKDCPYVDDIIVSTEDDKIMDIAFKNDVKGMIRDKFLCGDTEVVDVYIDVVNKLDKRYDYVVAIQPDHPDREHSLKYCLEYMVENYYDDLITVTNRNGDINAFQRSGSVRIFKYNHLLAGHVSKRIGCVKCNATDIHYQKDLDLARKNIEG
jgi:rhamnosyltransferase